MGCEETLFLFGVSGFSDGTYCCSFFLTSISQLLMLLAGGRVCAGANHRRPARRDAPAARTQNTRHYASKASAVAFLAAPSLFPSVYDSSTAVHQFGSPWKSFCGPLFRSSGQNVRHSTRILYG